MDGANGDVSLPPLLFDDDDCHCANLRFSWEINHQLNYYAVIRIRNKISPDTSSALADLHA